MNAVVLYGQGKSEAAQNQCNGVIHIGLGHDVGGGKAEEREEEERGKGSDGHGDGIGEPPEEDPGQHPEHDPALPRLWTANVRIQACYHASQRTRDNGETIGRYNRLNAGKASSQLGRGRRRSLHRQ